MNLFSKARLFYVLCFSLVICVGCNSGGINKYANSSQSNNNNSTASEQMLHNNYSLFMTNDESGTARCNRMQEKRDKAKQCLQKIKLPPSEGAKDCNPLMSTTYKPLLRDLFKELIKLDVAKRFAVTGSVAQVLQNTMQKDPNDIDLLTNNDLTEASYFIESALAKVKNVSNISDNYGNIKLSYDGVRLIIQIIDDKTSLQYFPTDYNGLNLEKFIVTTDIDNVKINLIDDKYIPKKE